MMITIKMMIISTTIIIDDEDTNIDFLFPYFFHIISYSTSH